MASLTLTRSGMARLGVARRGLARQGTAWWGEAGRGLARHSMDFTGKMEDFNPVNYSLSIINRVRSC